MADLQEMFWENLLDYIQGGTVVPVIGPELVTVREGDRDVPLYRWIGQRLAADLNLPTAELPASFDLNDVVSLHLRRRGKREELYPQIHRMLQKAALKPPEALRALAGISGFKLFVSLTFDSLLADALGAAEQISYSPKTRPDLLCPKAELEQPVVFHLLGRASASPNYAICDVDLLEFLHGIQDKQRQPQTLFDELRENHLLILGCNFGDWLARFFLRIARSVELSQNRMHSDMLVGEIAHDANLALFLESFSPDTCVIPLTAEQFVTELASRWHARPAEARSAEPVGPKDGEIFVSYASEDLEAATRLAEGLRAARLEVWFDKRALHMGDDWEQRIRRAIKNCSLFLPVISRQALSEKNRRGRYFWQEWRDADALTERMALDETFIIPVVIDDTSIDLASLPDSFRRVQGGGLLDGNVTPEVVARLQKLVRDFRRRQQPERAA